MKIFFYYLGLVLQIFGLATMMGVIILFFGNAKMGPLLYLTILGVAEFYGGYCIVRFWGEKK